MIDLKVLEKESTTNVENFATRIASKLDFLDVEILRKFYVAGDKFPDDIQPYCFPILYLEMRNNNDLKIGIEALRKRLDNLVKFDFLEKVNKANPTIYYPVKGREALIRLIIVKFFALHGLQNFYDKSKK